MLRITNGLMNEIDFAVELPEEALGGGYEEIEVDETIRFDPDSDRPASALDRERLTDLAERLGGADEISIRITGFTETKSPPGGETETVMEERSEVFSLTPHFPILSAELQPEDLLDLDAIIDEWKDAKRVKIDVEGHTSSATSSPITTSCRAPEPARSPTTSPRDSASVPTTSRLPVRVPTSRSRATRPSTVVPRTAGPSYR